LKGAATASRPIVALTFGASLAGVAVSGYLTVVHFTSSAILICSGSGLIDCERVTTGPYSELFGVPVAILGLAWWVAMAALTSPWAWGAADPRIGWLRLGLAAAGVVFVLYLVWAELFPIGAICLWCTVVHVLAFVLFVAVALEGIPVRT
jgi:uncharacterized membrane protein